MTPLRCAERSCALLATFLVGLTIGWHNRSLLPDRFFFDADRLAAFTAAFGNTSRDGSYQATASIFRFFGLVEAPRLVGLITYLLMSVLVLTIWRDMESARYNWGRVTALAACLLLTSIFMFDYNKEIVVVVLVVAFVRLHKTCRGEIAALAGMSLYGLTVRNYWLLIVISYVTLRIVTRRRQSALALFGAAIVLLAIFAGVFRFVLGVPANHYRVTVLQELSVRPDSVIVDPLPSANVVFDLINIFHTWLSLMIPYPLLGGNAQQLLSFALLSAAWGAVWLALARSGPKLEESYRFAALAISVSLAMSLFEPDYGSYLRHLVPVLPLMIAAATRRDASSESQPESRTDWVQVHA